MEKFNNPYIDKLAGLPEEHKGLENDWHKYIIEHIQNAGGKKIESFEINKTEKDVELIQFAEKSVDDLLRRHNRQKVIDVSLDNIHILRKNGVQEFTQNTFFEGAHSTTRHSVIVDRNPSDVQFSLILFHELVHLKSYSALQILPGTNGGPAKTEAYRGGISVISRDGKTVYLGNLEEAIVGYLTEQFFETVICADARFKEELSRMNEEKIKVRISRKAELKKLNSVIDEIVAKNPHMYRTEIMNAFIDAQINGNLMTIGRLLEKTFGQGYLKGQTSLKTENDI